MKVVKNDIGGGKWNRSPLRPPAWLFDSPLTWDPDARDRASECFAEWWACPADGHPWVALRNWSGPADVLAWWDLGGRGRTGRRRQPRIEVAGEYPPEGPRVGVPEAIEAVGWWVIAGISPDDGALWRHAGVTDAAQAARWARLLGEEIQPRFPGTRLAVRQQGRWRPGVQANMKIPLPRRRCGG
ncbi:MAG TPA: hypothetical protein VG184_04955 [Acidimicrobiales bacterium]|nr:hypothetical protein [Acidimicrobiales bacterium]